MADGAGLAELLGHRPPRHRQPGLRLLEGSVRQHGGALRRRRSLRCDEGAGVFSRLAGIPLGVGTAAAGGFPGLISSTDGDDFKGVVARSGATRNSSPSRVLDRFASLAMTLRQAALRPIL